MRAQISIGFIRMYVFGLEKLTRKLVNSGLWAQKVRIQYHFDEETGPFEAARRYDRIVEPRR